MTNPNLNEINEIKKGLFKDLAGKVITTDANNRTYGHSSKNEFYQPSHNQKGKRVLYNGNGKQEISDLQELNNYNSIK